MIAVVVVVVTVVVDTIVIGGDISSSIVVDIIGVFFVADAAIAVAVAVTGQCHCVFNNGPPIASTIQ